MPPTACCSPTAFPRRRVALMGLYANYPIALAPDVSERVLHVSVCWECTSLGKRRSALYFFRVLFILLTITRVRERLSTASPIA